MGTPKKRFPVHIQVQKFGQQQDFVALMPLLVLRLSAL